jgi:methylmalonyl-CoA/ethylmalonyl-CoA epimerase
MVMSGKLDHIGIFVESLESAIPFYEMVIGKGPPIIREVPELGLRLAFFVRQGGEVIELVEAAGKTELNRGDVVVALEADDLEAEISRLRGAGIKVHHQKPTANLPLHRGWISKGDAHGTVIELCPKGEVVRFVRGVH